MRPILKGSTNQSVTLRFLDSATGLPTLSVDHDAPGLNVWYYRLGANATVNVPIVSLSGLGITHSDGGIEPLGNGWVHLDIPDATCAAGSNEVLLSGCASGIIMTECKIPLVDYDPYDNQKLGLSILDNIASNVTAIASSASQIESAIASLNDISVASVVSIATSVAGALNDLSTTQVTAIVSDPDNWTTPRMWKL